MEKVLEKSSKRMGCKDKNLLISEEIVKKTRVDKAHIWSNNFRNSKILYYLGVLLKYKDKTSLFKITCLKFLSYITCCHGNPKKSKS